MKKTTFAFIALVPILWIAPIALSATGDNIRITIQGGDLPSPIHITDPDVIKHFGVWTGPGTSSHQPQGLIVDWSQGMVKPREFLQVYQVAITTTRPEPHSTYVVYYAIDPSTNEGYVYLPGKTDTLYSDNTWLIYRGVEGNWFHAWSEWENLARPLMEKAQNAQK